MIATRPDALRLALLADRDDDTRNMYAEFLLREHIVVDHAADGREALAKAISRRPDALVTETRLPGIDGVELCRLLRGDNATAAMVLIVVTGDAATADLQRARDAGADSVLVKPCLPETLLTEIHRLVARSGELRQQSKMVRGRTAALMTRSRELAERPQRRSTVQARAHRRGETTTPPLPPPAALCPQCDRPLAYVHSHVGGVSARHSEQWDYFNCPGGCGRFQYRQRTRRLRKV